MEFRILGPLQVLDDGRMVPLGGAKQRSTLAMLLLGRSRVVSRDRLIDGIWGASPPRTAGPTLDTYISRIRRALPDDANGVRVLKQSPGYRLRVEPGELDLECFETLLERARTAFTEGDPESAVGDLREALSLFRGEPLEDLVHAPFAQAEIPPLEELRLDALEQRVEADLADGRHAELVGELQGLAANNPFRETVWAQLMIALYRSGRQGEALNAFDRARRVLAEELGLEPGHTLKQLHRQILEQDRSLERTTASSKVAIPAGRSRVELTAPSVGRTSLQPPEVEGTPAPSRGERPGQGWFHLRSRSVVAAIGVGLAVTALAILVPRLVGSGDDADRAYGSGTVLIDLETGKEIASIPKSRLAVAAYPIFADGRFWVNNWSPSAYVEIDPETGTIVKEISPPARDPAVHVDFSTVTPFAVEGNALWVNSGDDLVRMDTTQGKEIDRFALDELGEGAGVAEGVALGAGSLWVSRSVGRGQILRLDPATGRPEHVWDDVAPYLNLAYGDGSLWVADERGIARIDPETNRLTSVTGIEGNCGSGGGGCVLAGGGSGWTSHDSKGTVYKVDRAANIAATYPAGIGAGFMSFTDGVVWVANRDEGTVTGIDAVTGKPTEIFRLGHPVGPMAAGGGVLLAQIDPGPPVEDHLDAVSGKVARFFAHPGELGEEEPALNTDPGAIQIEFATCAKLLNYPSEPPAAGSRLRPEVATAMPSVSPDGRTYRFTVSSGYRFSPPSNERITAETFRYSIERALSPKLADNPTGKTPPGPRFLDDIEGERAFRAGKAQHITGLRTAGDVLSITLTRPSPDFLERLALPFFCPVPRDTPLVAGAPHEIATDGSGYIVSAGPYYVADYGDAYVILKRNPNYRGKRRHAFDAIVIRENADAGAALARIQSDGWDGITSIFDPALAPGGAVDQRWGSGTPGSPDERRYFLTPQPATRYIAFNADHGLFADTRTRRAAALAIDRTALAGAAGARATDQLLSPAFPAYREHDLYPLEPAVARARALMNGRRGRAVMPVPAACDQCAGLARIVRKNLAAIGIDVTIEKLDDFGTALQAGERFDLLDVNTELPYPDSASFLAQMSADVPIAWMPAAPRRQLRSLAAISGDERQSAAASLADRLATHHVSVTAYATPQISQVIAPRVGCRFFTPFAGGLDLAALCPDPT